VNILVTGSSGFVGSNLCRVLLARGHHVRAFHRPSSVLRLLDGLAVEHALGDLTQPETLPSAVEGIEVIFHAAAWMGGRSGSGKQHAVTVEGTRSLLQAAQKAGVRRVVHTSSVAALGVPEAPGKRPANPLLIHENHTWNYRPDWYPYGYAKYQAELEVQKAVAQGLDVVIVNPTVIFGPGDIYRQSSSIVNQVARRQISVTVEGGINIIHIADVTAGHLAALEQGRSGERYILGGENLHYSDLLRSIAEIAQVPVPQLALPAGLLRAAAGPAQHLQQFLHLPIAPELLRLAGYFFFYDTQKAQTQLDWKPAFSARQAIQDTYTWFKNLSPQSRS